MLSIQVDSIESKRIVSLVVDSSCRKSICETRFRANRVEMQRANRVESESASDELTQFGCIAHADKRKWNGMHFPMKRGQPRGIGPLLFFLFLFRVPIKVKRKSAISRFFKIRRANFGRTRTEIQRGSRIFRSEKPELKS